MKVIVWGINYSPELTGIAPYNTSLSEFLKSRGYSVDVVTSFAYYPQWRKQREDVWRFFRTDHINDVRVHRCWHFVPNKCNSIKRILHEGSFVVFSLMRLLTLPTPDVYIVISPPLALGIAAWMISKLKGSPFIFHVQDLQPDAAIGLGMLKKGWLTRVLYALETFAYEKAFRVSGISHGMVEAFRKKGVPRGKTVFFPNGVILPLKMNSQKWVYFAVLKTLLTILFF
jgi:colanic acid biosynthesis glycosyl transferase WcaI